MFISFGELMMLAFIIFGALMSKDIIRRFPKDLKEFKTTDDKSVKQVTVFYWILTGCYLLILILYVGEKIYRIFNPPV